jgi:hypothetical protein
MSQIFVSALSSFHPRPFCSVSVLLSTREPCIMHTYDALAVFIIGTEWKVLLSPQRAHLAYFRLRCLAQRSRALTASTHSSEWLCKFMTRARQAFGLARLGGESQRKYDRGPSQPVRFGWGRSNVVGAGHWRQAADHVPCAEKVIGFGNRCESRLRRTLTTPWPLSCADYLCAAAVTRAASRPGLRTF